MDAILIFLFGFFLGFGVAGLLYMWWNGQFDMEGEK